MSEHLQIDNSEGVLRIRFNRPDKKNALTAAMYAAMADALEAGEADNDLRAIVFLGSGGSFTAGNDLKDFLENPPLSADAPVFRFISALPRLAVPTIAAVDGAAVGVGTTMLLHCDFVYVTPGAKLQMPFVNLGLLPEAGSTYLLPRLVGPAKAAEITMLGEPFDGAEAVAMGLATALVDKEALEDKALATARTLAAKPPGAMRATRKLLRDDRDKVEQALMEEVRQFSERLTSPEAREAFAAFLEKRPPNFSSPGG
jgi:enoyl-CoA hydratase/carnithine racemase